MSQEKPTPKFYQGPDDTITSGPTHWQLYGALPVPSQIDKKIKELQGREESKIKPKMAKFELMPPEKKELEEKKLAQIHSEYAQFDEQITAISLIDNQIVTVTPSQLWLNDIETKSKKSIELPKGNKNKVWVYSYTQPNLSKELQFISVSKKDKIVSFNIFNTETSLPLCSYAMRDYGQYLGIADDDDSDDDSSEDEDEDRHIKQRVVGVPLGNGSIVCSRANYRLVIIDIVKGSNKEIGIEDESLSGVTQKDQISALEVLPQGQIATAGCANGDIHLWDIHKEYKCIAALKTYTCEFSRSNPMLGKINFHVLRGSYQKSTDRLIYSFKNTFDELITGEIKIFDLGRTLRNQYSRYESLSNFLWVALPRIIKIAANRGHVQLNDLQLGSICAVKMLDPQHLVSISTCGLLKVWNISKQECINTIRYNNFKNLDNKNEQIIKMAVLKDGEHVVTATNQKVITIWNVKEGVYWDFFSNDQGLTSELLPLPDGRVIQAENNRLYLLDTRIVLRDDEAPYLQRDSWRILSKEAISKNIKLQDLVINTGGGFRQSALEYLVEAILQSNLIRLDLSGNKFTTKQVIYLIGQLAKNRTIINFIFQNVNMQDTGSADMVAKLIARGCLQRLDLRGNGITDEGIGRIALSLKYNKNMTELLLGYQSITNEGAVVLAGSLENNYTLVVLDLNGNKILAETQAEINNYLERNRKLKTQLLEHIRTDQLNLIDNLIRTTGISVSSFSYLGHYSYPIIPAVEGNRSYLDEPILHYRQSPLMVAVAAANLQAVALILAHDRHPDASSFEKTTRLFFTNQVLAKLTALDSAKEALLLAKSQQDDNKIKVFDNIIGAIEKAIAALPHHVNRVRRSEALIKDALLDSRSYYSQFPDEKKLKQDYFSSPDQADSKDSGASPKLSVSSNSTPEVKAGEKKEKEHKEKEHKRSSPPTTQSPSPTTNADLSDHKALSLVLSAQEYKKFYSQIEEVARQEVATRQSDGDAKEADLDSKKITGQLLQHYNQLVNELTTLKERVDLNSSYPDLPEFKNEQAYINRYPELQAYHNQLRERLYATAFGAKAISSNQIQVQQTVKHHAATATSLLVGLIPILGSTVRSIVEGVALPTKAAFDLSKKRQLTRVDQAFGDLDQMRWLIKHIASKLAVLRTPELIENKNSELTAKIKQKFNSLDMRRLGHGSLTNPQILAVMDAEQIVEHTEKLEDIAQSREKHTIVLDRLLKLMINESYPETLVTLLSRPLARVPSQSTSLPTPLSGINEDKKNKIQLESKLLVDPSINKEVVELKKLLAAEHHARKVLETQLRESQAKQSKLEETLKSHASQLSKLPNSDTSLGIDGGNGQLLLLQAEETGGSDSSADQSAKRLDYLTGEVEKQQAMIQALLHTVGSLQEELSEVRKEGKFATKPKQESSQPRKPTTTMFGS